MTDTKTAQSDPPVVRRFPRIHKPKIVTRLADASYLSLTMHILAEAGRPVHITNITKRIVELKGKPAARASVEASLIRHIAERTKKGLSTEVLKVQPGYYSLPAHADLPLIPKSEAQGRAR